MVRETGNLRAHSIGFAIKRQQKRVGIETVLIAYLSVQAKSSLRAFLSLTGVH